MNKKALHVILAVITVVLCATTIFFRVKSDQATNNLRDSNKQVKKEKTKYEKKKSDISNNIYYYISKNGDEKTKPIGQQYVNSELLDTVSNKLFGFVFNYSNSDDYRKRKDLASSIATNDVLNNKTIFGDVKGANVIDSLGLKSSLDSVTPYLNTQDNNSIKGIVIVKYVINSSSGAKEGTKTYNVIYDKSQGKFSKVDSINY